MKSEAMPEYHKGTGYSGKPYDLTEGKSTESIHFHNDRELFNYSPLGIYRTNVLGEIIVVNNVFAKTFGYSDANDMMQNVDNVADSSYVSILSRHNLLSKLKKNKVVLGYETQLKKKDGSIFIAKITARAAINPNSGEIEYLEGFIEDISKQREYENRIAKKLSQIASQNQQLNELNKKLEASESKFRNIVEQSSDAIALTNESGQIIEWNEACESILNISKEEALNEFFWEIQYRLASQESKNQESYQQLKEAFLLALKEGNSPWFYEPWEMPITLKNGKKKYIEIVIFPIATNQGHMLACISRDFTIHKQAKDQLSRSESFNRHVLDNLEDGITVIKEGEAIYLNGKAHEILGYSSNEQFNSETKQFADPEIKLKIEQFKKMQKEGESMSPKTLEYWIQRNDGEKRYILNRYTCYIDNFDDKRTILVITTDLTRRKQIETALENSKNQWKKLYHNFPGGSYIVNDNYIIEDVNNVLCELTGYKKEELIGQKCGIICPKGPHQCPIFDLGKEKIENDETAIKAKDQNLIPIIKSAIKYTDPDTNRISIVENFQDIVKLKKVQNELIENEKLLKETQHIAQIGSLTLDLLTKKYTFSDNLFKILSIEQRDIKQSQEIRKILSIIHKDDCPLIFEWLKSSPEVLNKKELIYRINTPHNVKQIYSKCNIKSNEKGLPEKVIFTFQDITQQKNEEELKREVEIAEQSANFKQMFLANMSHEIRTPLTGVMGMINFLENTNLDDIQIDYVHTLKKSADNLLNIINDILILSKLEAGKMELKPVIIDVFEGQKEIQKLFSPLAKEKGIKLKLYYDSSLPQFIKVDENRLRQVLNNLISNAIKFTQKGYVEVKIFVLEEHANLLKLKAEVIDTGIGISKKDQQNLFTKFTQVDSSFSRNNQGIGLGLAISKEFVTLMGGEIGIESDINNGSKFWFTFNAEKSDTSAELKLSEMVAKNKIQFNMDVLLVEDILVNQKVARIMLEKAGCKVTIAENGQEAIDKYAENKQFDIIFMDIQMPVMDGITAVRILRESYENLPPIIGLSANAMEGDEEKYIAQGLDDYIAKPIFLDVLYNKLFKWFKK